MRRLRKTYLINSINKPQEDIDVSWGFIINPNAVQVLSCRGPLSLRSKRSGTKLGLRLRLVLAKDRRFECPLYDSTWTADYEYNQDSVILPWLFKFTSNVIRHAVLRSRCIPCGALQIYRYLHFYTFLNGLIQ